MPRLPSGLHKSYISGVHGWWLASQGFLDAGWGQVIVLCTLIKMKLYYNFHSQLMYLGQHFITLHNHLWYNPSSHKPSVLWVIFFFYSYGPWLLTTNNNPRQQTPEKLPNNYRTTTEPLLNNYCWLTAAFSRFHNHREPPLETTGYGSPPQSAEKGSRLSNWITD
jgi:hypothetical protein